MYNGHGDVVQLTDTTGAAIKYYDYDAFGNEKNPDVNDNNPFRYCGEYFDKETGTIYLRARYYDPNISRFTTEDSFTGEANDPLSLNLYIYCSDDPINNIDASGHVTTSQGTAVHIMLSVYFDTTYKGARSPYYISQGLKSTLTGRGFADLVYISPNDETRMASVFEIKPISYSTSTANNLAGKAQLADYIQAMNKAISSNYSVATAGTNMNVNGLVLPCPYSPNKVIVLKTDYDKDPGMIYYYDRKIQPQDEKVIQSVPGYTTAFDKQENNTDMSIGKKTAGAAAVGTALYWIISEGSRVVFPVRNLVPVP